MVCYRYIIVYTLHKGETIIIIIIIDPGLLQVYNCKYPA